MSVENRPADDTHRQLAEQNTRLHKLIDSNKKLFQALTDTSIEVANIEEIGKFERTETLARLNGKNSREWSFSLGRMTLRFRFYNTLLGRITGTVGL